MSSSTPEQNWQKVTEVVAAAAVAAGVAATTVSYPTIADMIADEANATPYEDVSLTQDAGQLRGRFGTWFYDPECSVLLHTADPLNGLFATGNSATPGAWRRKIEDNKIYSHMFGIFEGRIATPEQAIQNRKAIQAMVDLNTYRNLNYEMHHANQQTVIDRGIELGYGHNSFVSVVLRGASDLYRGQVKGVGSAIYVASAEPCYAFNIQGGRGSGVEGFDITMPLLEAYQTALIDYKTNPDVFLKETWNVGGESRYAPVAGIVVDARSGPKIANDHYPDIEYPAWLGIPQEDQYEKTFSSKPWSQNNAVRGAVVAYLCQPGDDDGNGDFLRAIDCTAEYCTYNFGVGNSQSRNVHIERYQSNRTFAGFTNKTFGRQVGQFGGNIVDMSLIYCVNIFWEMACAYIGNMKFDNFYLESGWSLGDLGTDATFQGKIDFESSRIRMTWQERIGASPAWFLSGTSSTAVTLRSCEIRSKGVVNFEPPNVSLPNCSYYNPDRSIQAIQPYEAAGHNCLSGGVLLNPLVQTASTGEVGFIQYDVDTGLPVPSVEYTEKTGFHYGGRNTCIPHMVRRVKPSGSVRSVPFEKPDLVSSWAKTGANGFTNKNLVAGVLTMTLPASLTETRSLRDGFMVGDPIFFHPEGTVFVISERVGQDITAIAWNNRKPDGSQFTPIDMENGVIYGLNSRLYTPRHGLFGEITEGSALITRVERNDGYDVWVNDEPDGLKVGDMLLTDFQGMERYFPFTRATITEMDEPGERLTMVGPAYHSSGRKRLDMWLRTPPSA